MTSRCTRSDHSRPPFFLALVLFFAVAAAPFASSQAAAHPARPAPAPSTRPTTPPPAPVPAVVAPNTIGPLSAIHPPPANFAWPNGATYVYSVEWRMLNAGTATLRMQAAGREQRILGTADATGVVALLYHVADRFESFVDPRTFCSLTISKHTEEGRRRLDTNTRFDYPHHKSALDEKNYKTGESKHLENGIPGCTTDVLSALFYVASLPLAPNAAYTFPIADGGKSVDLTVHVEAREPVAVPAGTFNTVRVQPESNSPVIRGRGKIWVWFSDDAAHTPVQMRASMFWGTLNFKLLRVEKEKGEKEKETPPAPAKPAATAPAQPSAAPAAPPTPPR